MSGANYRRNWRHYDQVISGPWGWPICHLCAALVHTNVCISVMLSVLSPGLWHGCDGGERAARFLTSPAPPPLSLRRKARLDGRKGLPAKYVLNRLVVQVAERLVHVLIYVLFSYGRGVL